MSRCQQDHLVHKDRRLQKIVEILNHLKIIKFHVWENTFEESVKDLRAEELESLREFLLLQAFQARMPSINLRISFRLQKYTLRTKDGPQEMERN